MFSLISDDTSSTASTSHRVSDLSLLSSACTVTRSEIRALFLQHSTSCSLSRVEAWQDLTTENTAHWLLVSSSSNNGNILQWYWTNLKIGGAANLYIPAGNNYILLQQFNFLFHVLKPFFDDEQDLDVAEVYLYRMPTSDFTFCFSAFILLMKFFSFCFLSLLFYWPIIWDFYTKIEIKVPSIGGDEGREGGGSLFPI